MLLDKLIIRLLIDGKTKLIETSLDCDSFVATSNHSKSSFSSDKIALSVEDI